MADFYDNLEDFDPHDPNSPLSALLEQIKKYSNNKEGA